MENNSYNELIDAYLDGELSPMDKQAFETALQKDTDLQDTLRWHRLANKTLASNAQDAQIRAIADNMRLRVGKLPNPNPQNLWQKLLGFVKTPLGIVGSLSLVAVLSVLGYAQTLKSEMELVHEFAFKPADSRVAGSMMPSNEIAFLSKLSTLYFTETSETALEKLSVLRGGLSPKTDSLNTTLIDYYAAHADISMGQYAAAQTLFSAIITQQAFLKSFSVTSDIGKLRFNRILAQLALNHNDTEAMAALEMLSKEGNTKGEVKERAKNLATALAQPLRRFKMF